MIIIEGPDGSGKTTLLNHMLGSYTDLKMAPRACTSLGGPVRGSKLVEWLREYGAMPGYIYDRHPCISGAVYDSVFLDPHSEEVQLRLHRTMKEVMKSSRVIYCRPPRRAIVEAVNEGDQMEGVERNIHRIIDTYDSIMANMIPHERYDWTEDELPSL